MSESPGTCLSVTKDLLSYKETTDVGQSGGPIILERNGKFYVVGIHILGD
jgi:V8-like Glu-specific endopeptidase